MTWGELLRNASRELSGAGIAEPAREAALLMMLATGKDRAFVAAHPEYDLTTKEYETALEYIRRRTGREPYQYISGKQEFFGLEFEVTADVLIPRPETEILVAAAIDELKKIEQPYFLEIGTGSGCISISVLKNVPTSVAIAADISPSALEVAARNAAMHGVSDRLELRRSSIFDPIGDELFDAILSNPPYVPANEIGSLQPEVRDHEPHIALDGGMDGLDIIRILVDEAPAHLKPGGTLMLEIGYDQAERVTSIFDRSLWRSPSSIDDLQGIPRCIVTCLRRRRSR